MAESKLVKDFLENRDVLLAFILALTRDRAIAEEIFQEVAVSVLNEDKRGMAPDNFLAWTREIARRRVAEYFRKQSQRRQAGEKLGAMNDLVQTSFEEHLMSAEENRLRQEFLSECMKLLSERTREIIERRYRDDCSVKDIAAAMTWEEASVKVALSRARKALLECVQTRFRQREAGTA